MSISPRICRMASTTCMTQRISASAAASAGNSAAVGHGASMMLSPLTPASGATRNQISSVIKGISGCNSRSSVSNTANSVRCAPWRAASSWVCSTGLTISRYQSQNSCQVNSYKALAAKS